MADRIVQNSSVGLGLLDLLTVAFVVLKLTGFIAWSWWWVLSPTLIPLGIVTIFIAFIITFLLFKKLKKLRKRKVL